MLSRHDLDRVRKPKLAKIQKASSPKQNLFNVKQLTLGDKHSLYSGATSQFNSTLNCPNGVVFNVNNVNMIKYTHRESQAGSQISTPSHNKQILPSLQAISNTSSLNGIRQSFKNPSAMYGYINNREQQKSRQTAVDQLNMILNQSIHVFSNSTQVSPSNLPLKPQPIFTKYKQDRNFLIPSASSTQHEYESDNNDNHHYLSSRLPQSKLENLKTPPSRMRRNQMMQTQGYISGGGPSQILIKSTNIEHISTFNSRKRLLQETRKQNQSTQMMIMEQCLEENDHKNIHITTSIDNDNILNSKETFSRSVLETKGIPTKPPMIKVTRKEQIDNAGESFTLSPWRKSPFPFTPNQGQSNNSFRYLSQLTAAQFPKNDTLNFEEQPETNKGQSNRIGHQQKQL
ncbi:UNKNOWN [Stylonychia lemnae]|uniref:Uncharacterized protein n=1 Tax=Stylonychia lemnae TaxID=5949 RepID=A0A078AGK4_STYLE|nr:UNKNOWN [Stylonychia lemnae]|eukprot:CDW80667.1 UNKNOWN [Stylonychia lemnae]